MDFLNQIKFLKENHAFIEPSNSCVLQIWNDMSKKGRLFLCVISISI